VTGARAGSAQSRRPHCCEPELATDIECYSSCCVLQSKYLAVLVDSLTQLALWHFRIRMPARTQATHGQLQASAFNSAGLSLLAPVAPELMSVMRRH
jgi:hypothetical protein